MRIIKLKNKGIFVELYRDEATSLIISLCRQIEENDPNIGRREYSADGCPYFSIAVMPTGKVSHHKKLMEEFIAKMSKKDRATTRKWLDLYEEDKK